MNATFSECTSAACTADAEFTGTLVNCTNDYSGATCTSKYCLASSFTKCSSTDTDCAAATTTVSTCDTCTAAVGDCTTSHKCNSDKVDSGTAGAQTCITPASATCNYKTWSKATATCTKDSLGEACKCCVTSSGTSLADDTGMCIVEADNMWFKDAKANLEKAFKG